MVTIHEAIDIVLASVNPLPSEEAPLLHAFGRSAAADEVSAEPVPPFDNSAMDGYAVRAEEVAAGRRRFRVVVEVPAGRWVDREIGAGEAARIMTGAPLPPGLDAVVPFEVVEEDGDAVTLSADVRSGPMYAAPARASPPATPSFCAARCSGRPRSPFWRPSAGRPSLLCGDLVWPSSPRAASSYPSAVH